MFGLPARRGEMTAPLDVAGSGSDVRPEAIVEGMSSTAVEGRSLGQIAWLRFKRDKVAIASAVVIVLLIVFAIIAPLINKWEGVNTIDDNQSILNFDTGIRTQNGHIG